MNDSVQELPEYIDAQDRDGHTPLFWAVFGGQAEAVTILLESGANPGKDPSCVVWACGLQWTDTECLQSLLRAGCDPNGKDLHGLTALHVCSIRSRSSAFYKLLIAAGADPDAIYHGRLRTLDGLTVLGLACLYGTSPEVITLLLQHADYPGSNRTKRPGVLALAARRHPESSSSKNSAEILKVLLEWGADVYASDEAGLTAAQCAIQNDDVASVKVLMDHGAIKSLSESRSTVTFAMLHWSVRSNAHNVLRYILSLSDTHVHQICGEKRQTIFHVVALHADLDSIAILRDLAEITSMNPDLRDATGNTASDYSALRTAEVQRAIEEMLRRAREETLHMQTMATEQSLQKVPNGDTLDDGQQAAPMLEHVVNPAVKKSSERTALVAARHADSLNDTQTDKLDLDSCFDTGDALDDRDYTEWSITAISRVPQLGEPAQRSGEDLRRRRGRVKSQVPESQLEKKLATAPHTVGASQSDAPGSLLDSLGQQALAVLSLGASTVAQFPWRGALTLAMRSKAPQGKTRIKWTCVSLESLLKLKFTP